jgi:hypothetical protein
MTRFVPTFDRRLQVGAPGGAGPTGIARRAREEGYGLERLAAIQETVLDVARSAGYEGYSKHDALNAPCLEAIAGGSRWARLLAIQAVMRSPLHVRPLIGVRRARNVKGLSLFARALLARYRVLGDDASAEEARHLLTWLADHPSPGFPWTAWGYPYPWEDVGFFAPRHFPNRVVTSFVVQALLDGHETLADQRLLHVAVQAVEFLLEAPTTLYEDERHRCVSYVPSDTVSWIVLDVPALTGAAVARLAALRKDAGLMREAARLMRYVVSKQTDYGAWYYADPPSASHITHDNYHTGFILDAILEYGRAAQSSEFEDAYRRGVDFYRERLFEPDGAPRFMHDRKYPFDIHGAAQGIITFARAQRALDEGCDLSARVLNWTLANMYNARTHWFYYQKHRPFRTPIRLLRWCQAWMAWAIGCHLECCGSPS